MKEELDNLVSKAKIRILDALCEGPIKGFVSGNDNYGPMKSTFLNDTVLMNANNTFNFNVSGDNIFQFALGESGQAALPEFGRVETFLPLSSNTEVKQLRKNPTSDSDYKDVVVSFNNRTYPDAGTARITVRVPQLLTQVDPTRENKLQEPMIQGYQLKYKIECSLNGGAYTQIGNEITIFGKTTSGYSKTIEVPLPSDGSNFLSWKLRIRRTTENISTLKIANTLLVDAVSIISTNEYKYPNTVLVGMEFDSERLGGSIPSRAYEIYGLKVKIPSNYNPDTRTYTGIWLGDFKAPTAQGSNIITNGGFTTNTAGWTAYRSSLTRSTSSPPGSTTAYGVVTVDIPAAEDKTYFSIYQSPSAPQSTVYIVKGYYKVSNSALNFKIGINNTTVAEYTTIGNSTDWQAFETRIISAGYSDGGNNWVEFVAQRSGECLTGDSFSITDVQVMTPADDGKQYTNNPAWVFYDICTNTRYGLGNYIRPEWIDKWTLYQIGQYCDEMVDDGQGGQEPRFTCNVVITQQEDAYKVLLNLVSIFRGMLYFANGRLFPIQDALKTYTAQFTNANVIDGVFNYGSSSKRTRHTVALVKWNDPKNSYRETAEVVEDTDGVTKFGYQVLEMSAFGCTSQGQAYRAGKWALVSEALETETVTFKTALEGTYLRPGDIFQVYDNARYNLNQGGRLLNVYSPTNVVLDRDVEIQAGYIYDLTVTTPRFYLEATGEITGSDQIGAIRNSQVVTSRLATTSYTGRDITVSSSLGSEIGPGSIWTLSLVSGNASATVRPKQYRCLATAEYKPFEIEVLGLEYSTGKFGLIETGFSVINNQVYENAAEAPPVPGGFSDGTYQRLGVNYIVDTEQNFVREYLELDWFPVESPILKFYRVRVTPPGGSPQIIAETMSDVFAYALSGCRPAGFYQFSVTSVGKALTESAALTGGYLVGTNDGIKSLTYNTSTPITGVYGTPIDSEWLLSGFETRAPTLHILRNTGEFDGNDPRFFYITGYEFQLTEVNAPNTVLLDLGKHASETVRLSSANINSIANRRAFGVKVTPLSCIESGGNGFGAFTQTMTNKPPLQAANATFTNGGGGVNFNIGPNAHDTDVSGVYLWSALTTASFTPSFGNQTLISDNLAGTHSLSATGAYNFWYSLIDSYWTGGCVIYGPSTVNYVGVAANSVAPGSIDYTSFVSGVEPIRVVSALPATCTVGQIVLLSTDRKLYRCTGNAWTTVVDNADIAAAAITTDKILDGAVSELKVANSAISANKLATNAVTADKITANAVISDKIAANAIVAGKIAALAVTAGTIAARAITGQNIAFGTLRGENIAANTITGNNLVIGTIEGGFIAADAISGNHIRAGQITANKLSVTQLSAITADMGTVTAGTYLTNSTASNQLKLNSAGLQMGADSNDRISIISAPSDGSNHRVRAYNSSNNLVADFGVIQILGTNDGYFALFDSAGNVMIDMYGKDGGANFTGPIYTEGDINIGTASVNRWLYLAHANAQMVIGGDTNLYRQAANQLKTDDDFYALSLTATSSRRFKKNIRPMQHALKIVNMLSGVHFDWTIRDRDNDFGLIAEDVANILPTAVGYDESGYAQGLDYGRLTSVLVEAVKELTLEVKTLKSEISDLKNG